MPIVRKSAAMLAIAVSLPTSSYAGPCTAEIGRIQVEIDKQIEITAGKGKTAKQTVGAQLGHQPTPQSIADAEAALGEGAPQAALHALERARELDKKGDAKGCTLASQEAQRALKRK
jgi:hypothetical protein